MREYVYALHDFTPQIADEIAFKAGDAIEVIEKDDLYQDGWWQVSCIFRLSGFRDSTLATLTGHEAKARGIYICIGNIFISVLYLCSTPCYS